MNQLFNFISENKELVLTATYAIYEIIIRTKPTLKTYSIITLIGRLIEDKNASGGSH